MKEKNRQDAENCQHSQFVSSAARNHCSVTAIISQDSNCFSNRAAHARDDPAGQMSSYFGFYKVIAGRKATEKYCYSQRPHSATRLYSPQECFLLSRCENASRVQLRFESSFFAS